MKRLMMLLAMVAAVAVGLLLPYGALVLEDWNLEKPGVLAAEEPSWTIPPQEPSDIRVENKAASSLSSAELAHRLQLFGIGGFYEVPLTDMVTVETERDWAISRATDFMEALCEETELHAEPEAEYDLQIFDYGENMVFWKVRFFLANDWTLTVLLDRESGALLQFYLMGLGGSLMDVFPKTSRESGETLEEFKSMVSLRTANVVEQFVAGQSSETSAAVWYDLSTRSMTVNFGHTPEGYYEASCDTYFEVNVFEGIYFNNGNNVRPAY